METLHVPHWIARIVNYSHLGVVGGYHSDPATCDLAWGWAMRALPWFVRQLTVVESVDDLGMASPGGLVCIRRARPLSRRDMRRVTRAHARGVRVLVVFTFADNHLPRRRRSYIDPLPTLPALTAKLNEALGADGIARAQARRAEVAAAVAADLAKLTAQAEALARSLAGEPIGAIYASDLGRVRDTAAPTARALELAQTDYDAVWNGFHKANIPKQ
jgi:hypothetical protein